MYEINFYDLYLSATGSLLDPCYVASMLPIIWCYNEQNDSGSATSIGMQTPSISLLLYIFHTLYLFWSYVLIT
jgi:hypothetical protein